MNENATIVKTNWYYCICGVGIMARIITLLEKFCPKCKKYAIGSFKPEDETKLGRTERCVNCHTRLTFALAIYERREV